LRHTCAAARSLSSGRNWCGARTTPGGAHGRGYMATPVVDICEEDRGPDPPRKGCSLSRWRAARDGQRKIDVGDLERPVVASLVSGPFRRQQGALCRGGDGSMSGRHGSRCPRESILKLIPPPSLNCARPGLGRKPTAAGADAFRAPNCRKERASRPRTIPGHLPSGWRPRKISSFCRRRRTVACP